MILSVGSRAVAFDGGTGSSSDPYIVTTALDVKYIATAGLTAHFKLAADIDMAGVEFTPIGDGANKFTGSLDGNGYTISNLTIGTASSPYSSKYVGLFGYLNGTVKNLTLSNGRVIAEYSSGACYAGMLCGYAGSSATITGCSATSNVSATCTGYTAYAGGLAGYAANTISDSFAAGDVTAQVTTSNYAYAGGLADYAENTITNCYATGDVTAETSAASGSLYAGGLVGEIYDQ
jgi:hypothetical protein